MRCALRANALLLDHFEHPRGAGAFDPDTAGVRYGEAGSEHHGAVVRFGLKCGADGRIDEARFQAWGCPATIACASLVAEWAGGRSLADAAALGVRELAAPLDLPTDRLYAPLLVEDALHDAAGG